MANEPDLYINEIYPNAGTNGFIELYTKVGFQGKSSEKFGIALIGLRRTKAIVSWLYDLSSFTSVLMENSYIIIGKLGKRAMQPYLIIKVQMSKLDRTGFSFFK